MSKKKPRIRTGPRAASKTGGKRRAKFQAWRTTDGKTAPVVVKRLGEELDGGTQESS